MNLSLAWFLPLIGLNTHVFKPRMFACRVEIKSDGPAPLPGFSYGTS